MIRKTFCYFQVMAGALTETHSEALRWLRKAFRQGDSSAATNIAITYRENGFFFGLQFVGCEGVL